MSTTDKSYRATKSARRTLTERRAEELRLTIAQAAMELFVADGDTSATVDRISEVVGIAPRTFHRHFPAKEDVVRPLFQRSSQVITAAIEQAAPDNDVVDVIVDAFTLEIRRHSLPEFDRKFMTLMADSPQYRLRWLETDEEVCDAVTKLLATRMDLPADPFLRSLPGQLIGHTSRQVYVHWATTGETFDRVPALLRQGIAMILAGVNALSAPQAGHER
ncbi:TetR/AcrR family transcriptional regulator [Nocardia salmonicida]|uniref:TetR/AcrR family transcriptional regulator n=1 Tax=Nocardia salmonicida TaxID=53431 RepID=UPI00378F918A